ncbi:cathelicidin antimicrobial peptide-like [Macrotis lagotis]|uniref:cathelicidin antimicrobial peptide-like n=1 Tax=Macrotis lagotis TaxID=92651 RepID=UPI003D68A9DF
MQASLLVLGLLSLMTSLSSAQDLRYHNLVNRFINDYNRKEKSENLFRLSVLNLEPGENNNPATRRPLSFIINETVCLKTENKNPDDCAFKENGVMKECIGVIILDSAQPSVDVNCDGLAKVKRLRIVEKIKNLLKKASDKIKDTFKNAINSLLS